MSVYRICPRFSWKSLASGSVILDLEKGSYFTLNETAALIWAGIVDGQDAGAIAASLMESFDVTVERARRDTKNTIEMLLSEGVVESGVDPGKAAHNKTGGMK